MFNIILILLLWEYESCTIEILMAEGVLHLNLFDILFKTSQPYKYIKIFYKV